MQRAPFYGAGRIPVEEGFGHESGSGDLLVKIRASAVCGSDVGSSEWGNSPTPDHETTATVAGWDRAPVPCRSSRLRVPGGVLRRLGHAPFGQQVSLPRQGSHARRRLRRRLCGRYRPGRALPFRGRRVPAGPSVSMCPQSRRWSWGRSRWDSAAYSRGRRSGSATSRPSTANWNGVTSPVDSARRRKQERKGFSNRRGPSFDGPSAMIQGSGNLAAQRQAINALVPAADADGELPAIVAASEDPGQMKPGRRVAPRSGWLSLEPTEPTRPPRSRGRRSRAPRPG